MACGPLPPRPLVWVMGLHAARSVRPVALGSEACLRAHRRRRPLRRGGRRRRARVILHCTAPATTAFSVDSDGRFHPRRARFGILYIPIPWLTGASSSLSPAPFAESKRSTHYRSESAAGFIPNHSITDEATSDHTRGHPWMSPAARAMHVCYPASPSYRHGDASSLWEPPSIFFIFRGMMKMMSPNGPYLFPCSDFFLLTTDDAGSCKPDYLRPEKGCALYYSLHNKYAV